MIKRRATVCESCGLCCNGVLFGNVKLQLTDDPAHLKGAGLPVRFVAKHHQFSQPCACLHGALCKIYGDRPSHCRLFECRVLQRLGQGDISEKHARDLVIKTKAQVEIIETILEKIGDPHAELPLNKRYAKALAAPVDLSNPSAGRLRGKLLREVGKLTEMLREFVD